MIPQSKQEKRESEAKLAVVSAVPKTYSITRWENITKMEVKSAKLKTLSPTVHEST